MSLEDDEQLPRKHNEHTSPYIQARNSMRIGIGIVFTDVKEPTENADRMPYYSIRGARKWLH